MKQVDSIEGLRAEILNQLEKTIRQKVAPLVKKRLQESAEENAAGETSRMHGGIADIDNIVDSIYTDEGGVTLIVKDVAKPQESVFDTPINGDPTLFSEWIEYGQWMELSTYMQTGEKTKRPARPFVIPVENELLTSGEVENLIKHGLE